jgi:hypothetical protein
MQKLQKKQQNCSVDKLNNCDILLVDNWFDYDEEYVSFGYVISLINAYIFESGKIRKKY